MNKHRKQYQSNLKLKNANTAEAIRYQQHNNEQVNRERTQTTYSSVTPTDLNLNTVKATVQIESKWNPVRHPRRNTLVIPPGRTTSLTLKRYSCRSTELDNLLCTSV